MDTSAKGSDPMIADAQEIVIAANIGDSANTGHLCFVQRLDKDLNRVIWVEQPIYITFGPAS